MNIRIVAALMMLAMLPAVGLGADVKLGKRHRDLFHGYSIIPPAGATIIQQASPTILAVWHVKDKMTGAIRWSITVQQFHELKEQKDLDVYAKKICKTQIEATKSKVHSVNLTQTAGTNSIEIKSSTDNNRFWQKQVWVQVKPAAFLVFTFSGPSNKASQLDTDGIAILKTLQLTDTDKYLARNKKNKQRAVELLASLTAKKISTVIKTTPVWYLMSYKGKTVGWMRQIEGDMTHKKQEGVRITSWAMAKFPQSPPRFMKRDFFTAHDRKSELWWDVLRQDSNGKISVREEDGMRQAEAIIAKISLNKKSRSLSSKMPKLVEEIYTPKVLDALVYRLIDRSKGGGYLFATYNAAKGSKGRFDSRTVTVEGTERITIDGKSLVATKITDQKHYDTEISAVWVDRDGMVLRLESETKDFVITLSTRQKVLLSYPKASSDIKMLDSRTSSLDK